MRLYSLLKPAFTRIKTLWTDYGTRGTIYTGSTLTTSVANAATVTVAEMTLPAGTYIVAGNLGWTTSGTGKLSILILRQVTPSALLAQVRGTMDAGGGDNASAIVKITETTKIQLQAYQNRGGATSVHGSLTWLKAIRIK